MAYKVIAVILAVLALSGVGYYAHSQYRVTRFDVLEALRSEQDFYDQVPLAAITTLPPEKSARLSEQLRAAVAVIAPDTRISDELLTVETSGEWNRVVRVSVGKFETYEFSKATESSTSVGGQDIDYALFQSDGVVHRALDKRTFAAVGIPTGPEKGGIALGYFELTPAA